MDFPKRRLSNSGTVVTSTLDKSAIEIKHEKLSKNSEIVENKELKPTWGQGLFAKKNVIMNETNKEVVKKPSLFIIFNQSKILKTLKSERENYLSLLQNRKSYLETKLYMYNTINNNELDKGIDMISYEETDEDKLISRIYAENKQKQQEMESQLYASGHNKVVYNNLNEIQGIQDSITTFNKYKPQFIKKMTTFINEKRNYCLSLASQYISIQKKYFEKEREIQKAFNSEFRYDPNEKPKTSSTRSMRNSRTHTTTSILDESSITSTDAAYFVDKQGDPPQQIIFRPLHYINTSNNILTLDHQPQKCFNLDDAIPCSPDCNCVYNIQRDCYLTKPWSYLEQFIFIDLFFQKPKNFHYISQHLTNRNTSEVIDYYYRMKKGLHIPLLLRVYVSLKRQKIGDQRPLVLAAAYAIGLPIPLSVFTPDYANVNIYEFLNEYEYNQQSSEYIQQQLPFHYDGIEMTPKERRERRALREKEIEHLIEMMGIDLKGCIPPNEPVNTESRRGRKGNLKNRETNKKDDE